MVELVKTVKNSEGVIIYEMDDKDKRKVKVYGNYTFSKTQPKIDVTRTVTPGAAGASFNTTKIDVTFTYTETGDSGTLKLKTAELKMTIEWGAPTSVLTRP